MNSNAATNRRRYFVRAVEDHPSRFNPCHSESRLDRRSCKATERLRHFGVPPLVWSR